MTADEFKKRYLKYHNSLYKLAYVMTSSPHDAEDLLQDLYMKMWQIRDSLYNITDTEAFMATVMRRIYYDRIRAKAVDSKTLSLDDLSDVSSPIDMELQLEHQDQCNEIENFIGNLPPKEQKIIRMHLLEDRDYKEIGSVTGMTQGSIRILVMRAKNKIKQRFYK